MIKPTPVIIGIDPGNSGALCVLRKGRLLSVLDIPNMTIKRSGKNRTVINEHLLVDEIRHIIREHMNPLGDIYAVVEEVGAMPKDGPVQAFSFGKAYGTILGLLAYARIPVITVRPNTWKNRLKLRDGKDGSRQRATEIWPSMSSRFSRKQDNDRAEAALIAYWYENYGAHE